MSDADADLDLQPVGADEAARLLAALAAGGPLLIAVSGGADSMALLLLAARWRAARIAAGARAPDLVAATIDHGLRPTSAAEADWVAGRARGLGVTHRITTWPGPPPVTGIEAAARRARYQLLGDLARRLGAMAIVTAHTRDDQAETLLMRLARGSGVDGLAGMPWRQPLDAIIGPGADALDAALADRSRCSRGLPPAKGGFGGSGDGATGGAGPAITGRTITVHRPLLAIAKSRLVATLVAAGADWLEDPSNDDPAFERTGLRRARSGLAALGLTSGPIALSARRLARAGAALERATDALWRRLVDVNGGAFGALSSTDLAALATEPEELRVRLLARLLGAFGGTGRRAPLERAEQLEAWLGRVMHDVTVAAVSADTAPTAPARTAATTIAGCRVAVAKGGLGGLRVWREWGRRGLPEIDLAPGAAAIWDGRFHVALSAGAVRPVRIGAVGIEGLRVLRAAGDGRLLHTAAIVRTLPAAWRDGTLIAAPLLGRNASCLSITFRA